MARLIDANVVLAKQFTTGLSDASGNYYGHADVVFVDDIENAPTVDAVEVVRCCDCKYSTLPSLVTQRYGVPGTLTCHNHNSPCNKRNVKCEGFCPYGERKDGEGNG